MTTQFTVILEDFQEELRAIRLLINSSTEQDAVRPRLRVAAANASVLLLAANFEEFVREMARAYAKLVVESCDSYERLPPKLAGTAWKRTLESLARIRFDAQAQNLSRERLVLDAHAQFMSVFEFSKGDLAQDIYSNLIHNENNMRPQELNSLFKLSGLSDVNRISSTYPFLMDHYEERDPNRVNGLLINDLEDFFERRNQVAHSINAMRSSGPEQIEKDIALLETFGRALCQALEDNLPAPRQSRDGQGDRQ